MKKFELLNETDLNEINGGTSPVVFPLAVFPVIAKWIAKKLFG